VWMLHGSCVSERPACSQSAGRLAASAAVPGAAEQVTSLAPVEGSAPPCSAGDIWDSGGMSDHNIFKYMDEILIFCAM